MRGLSRRAAYKNEIRQYLTFTVTDTSATFSWSQRAVSGTLEYSLDDGQSWTTIADGESTPAVSAGGRVMWRGNLRPTIATSNITTTAGIGTFGATGYFKASGNTMALLFYDNFASQLSFADDEFRCVFAALFYKNKYLLTAPAFPATILNRRCYHSTFRNCSSLTVAPELPASKLDVYSYYYMFTYCPFNYIKCLATDISASNCTTGWLSYVPSTGTFVKAASMQDWTTGTSGIPSGWTVVDEPNT